VNSCDTKRRIFIDLFRSPKSLIKGDVRNRASEALKTIVFQIDRSPRLFVQKSSEMVRLKAYDTDFAFL